VADGEEVVRWRTFVVAAGFSVVLAGGVMTVAAQPARLGQPAPDVAGDRWINSPPLTIVGLRGRVVLVEFWTYG
jgi:hypothetical protein